MSQFAGWLGQRYRVNRPLSEYERLADVRLLDSTAMDPIDQGIIKIDECSIEYVDRHFVYRGWGAMWGSLVAALALAFAAGILWKLSQIVQRGLRVVSSGDYCTAGYIALLCIGLAAFAYWMLIGKDIFRYQYYSVRFNRITRTVDVFVGGKRGAISAPWEDVHFFIGRDKPAGPGESSTYDLRGHIMEAGTIVHTFSVGSESGSSPGLTLAHWEMIRRYMESGMQHLPFPPLQLFTSTTPSFRNAVVIHVSSPGKGVMLVALPITLPWAVFRYLTMKLCRRPEWPSSAEAPADCRASGGAVLNAPDVYGRISQSAGGEAMLRYWEESIRRAKARDPELRGTICSTTVV